MFENQGWYPQGRRHGLIPGGAPRQNLPIGEPEARAIHRDINPIDGLTQEARRDGRRVGIAHALVNIEDIVPGIQGRVGEGI